MTRNPVGIIIQARMGSTRLPGKILKPVGSRTLLDHILKRLSLLRIPALPVIATSDSERDQVVERFCQSRRVACFRGSEADVLDRYYRCALQYGFQQVVRLTGDNPFPDPEELERLIALHTESQADYSHSFQVLPIGVGAEIFTMKALTESWLEGKAPQHREHVDEFLLENPQRFRTLQLEPVPAKFRPELRLTVDTEADYQKACFIAQNAASDCPATREVIALADLYDSRTVLP